MLEGSYYDANIKERKNMSHIEEVLTGVHLSILYQMFSVDL
jgi:hypothetical protein